MTAATGKACRNCGGRANRPRELCWHCFRQPGVRDRFPSTSKYGRRGPNPGMAAGRPPAEPTPATPGTPEKLIALAARVARGESLWHPLDPTFPLPNRAPTPESGQKGRHLLRRLLAIALFRSPGWTMTAEQVCLEFGVRPKKFPGFCRHHWFDLARGSVTLSDAGAAEVRATLGKKP
jgi:hypothetical protein